MDPIILCLGGFIKQDSADPFKFFIQKQVIYQVFKNTVIKFFDPLPTPGNDCKKHKKIIKTSKYPQELRGNT